MGALVLQRHHEIETQVVELMTASCVFLIRTAELIAFHISESPGWILNLRHARTASRNSAVFGGGCAEAPSRVSNTFFATAVNMPLLTVASARK
jgi:hypothetical protein